MKKNIVLIFVIGFLSKFCLGQDNIPLNNDNGLFVAYEIKELDKSNKKTTYLAIVSLENQNDYDLYYSVPALQQKDGTYGVSLLERKTISQTWVWNSTAAFGTSFDFRGYETDLLTTDFKKLFLVKRKSTIKIEKEFKIKNSNKPVLTNTFLIPLEKIEKFDLIK